jgi:hypothetical protein
MKEKIIEEFKEKYAYVKPRDDSHELLDDIALWISSKIDQLTQPSEKPTEEEIKDRLFEAFGNFCKAMNEQTLDDEYKNHSHTATTIPEKPSAEEMIVPCPECGAEIKFGISNSTFEVMRKSKFFKKPSAEEWLEKNHNYLYTRIREILSYGTISYVVIE